jgi:hypothetical protein
VRGTLARRRRGGGRRRVVGGRGILRRTAEQPAPQAHEYPELDRRGRHDGGLRRGRHDGGLRGGGLGLRHGNGRCGHR